MDDQQSVALVAVDATRGLRLRTIDKRAVPVGSAPAGRAEVGEALDRGRAGIAGSASVARDSFAEDMSRLRDDVASRKETLARFASQAGSEASQTLRQVGQTVASQVGTAASGVAEAGSVRVVFDNAQFLAWYRERFPISAM